MLSIDKNQMTIEHYQEVLLVSETLIKIRMPQMEISIRGDKLHMLALEKEEQLLEGCFLELTFQYES